MGYGSSASRGAATRRRWPESGDHWTAIRDSKGGAIRAERQRCHVLSPRGLGTGSARPQNRRLRLGSRQFGVGGTEDLKGSGEQVGLADVDEIRVRGFRRACARRLGLAAALLTRPRLLVLDEPGQRPEPVREADENLKKLATREHVAALGNTQLPQGAHDERKLQSRRWQ